MAKMQTALDAGLCATSHHVVSGRRVSCERRDDPQPVLTIDDIMVALRCSRRTAQRWLEAWRHAQGNDALPRLSLVSRGGRPGYRVEAESFWRWLGQSEGVAA
jgi:hypothetical protein